MKTNESLLDRIIRILLAVIITVLYFTGILKGAIGIILLILAILFFITALLGFCIIYAIFGIGTYKPTDEDKEEDV